MKKLERKVKLITEEKAQKSIGRKITIFLFNWRIKKQCPIWTKGPYKGKYHYSQIEPIQSVILKFIVIVPFAPICFFFFIGVLCLTGDFERAKNAAVRF